MKHPCVYIIHTADGALVKIGFTKDLITRWTGHRSKSFHQYGELIFVGAFAANSSYDSRLRKMVGAVSKTVGGRVKDWFVRNPEVDSIISSLPLETVDLRPGSSKRRPSQFCTITAPIPSDIHAVLKKQADKEGMKFSSFISRLLEHRAERIEKSKLDLQETPQ